MGPFQLYQPLTVSHPDLTPGQVDLYQVTREFRECHLLTFTLYYNVPHIDKGTMGNLLKK